MNDELRSTDKSWLINVLIAVLAGIAVAARNRRVIDGFITTTVLLVLMPYHPNRLN